MFLPRSTFGTILLRMTAGLLLCAIGLSEIPECITLTNDTSNDFVTCKAGSAASTKIFAQQSDSPASRLQSKDSECLDHSHGSITVIGIDVTLLWAKLSACPSNVKFAINNKLKQIDRAKMALSYSS